MKVLLIGNTKCSAAQRLHEEFTARGIEYFAVSSRGVLFCEQDGRITFTDLFGADLLDFDVYLFRGVGKKRDEFSVIARYLQAHGKLVVEDAFARCGIHIGKFAPTMLDRGVPVLDYSLLFSYADQVIREVEYPVVVKGLDGSQGKKVRLARDRNELEDYLEQFGYPILLQKYVPITHDYRVMVVDGQVLGVMARYNTQDDFLTIRKGGRREAATLPNEALDIALRAAQIAGLDVAGVDLLEYEGAYYRLEVNMSPQFRVFERVTGVNVAGAIVDMVVRRYNAAHVLQGEVAVLA